MTDIFRASRPVAQIPHNGFDKSRRDVFSTKCAILTPCFVEDVYPDSKFSVDNVNIVRVDSIQSAPFARLSQNIEYFFVPYSQLWHDFNRFYYERGDVQRNNANVQNVGQSSKVPTFNLRDFVEYSFLQYCALRVYRDVRDSVIYHASTSVPLNSRLSYVLDVLDDYFHRYTSQFSFNHFTADMKLVTDVHNRFCIEDLLRNADMLGYGNYLPAFKSFYSILRRGDAEEPIADLTVLFYTTDLPTFSIFSGRFLAILSQFYQPDSQALQFFPNYTRQLDRSVSIFRAAAYLKVWSDYYRNAQYDVDENYSYYFNYDYVVSDSASNVSVEKVMYCLIPRYRQWKKDVFTGCFPTAQFGSVSVAMTNNPVTISNSKYGTSAGNAANVYGSAGSNPGLMHVAGQLGSEFTWSIDSSVSALSIRQAMALQNYKERILRAGNRLPNLQRAVFGDNSRYLEDEYVDFIGASHSSIDINSVAATAESGSQNVGDLSSNGVSTYGGNVFNYHVHDFGIIIGLFYILPEAEYENFGIDRMATLTESYDFYKPDFANLGLSPVFNFDFNIQQYYFGSEQSLSDAVIGYLARYWQYKTSLDKVHGEFYSQSPILIDDDFMASDEVVDLTDYISTKMGAFANYVTPRDAYDTLSPRLSSLYCSPNSVDRIFYASSDEFQSSDQFKVNMSHQVKAILPMSVIGLPQ